MSKIVGNLFIYGVPTVLLAAGFGIGIFLARKGKRNFNASMMVAGIAIVVANLIISVLIIWSIIEIRNQGSFAGFLLLLIPDFAWKGILGSAAICISIAFIYVWFKRSSFRAAGYTQLPNLFMIALAFGTLLTASAIAWEKDLGARWHMWPYTTLSGSSGNPLVLHGWNPRKEQSDDIISIDRGNAPDWLVSYELSSMDAKGNISVRLDPVGGLVSDVKRRIILFEPSSYLLTNDGQLKRIE